MDPFGRSNDNHNFELEVSINTRRELGTVMISTRDRVTGLLMLLTTCSCNTRVHNRS